jgi:hypothetical protein
LSVCQWFDLKTTRTVCHWFDLSTGTVFSGLASKPVATVSPGLASKLAVGFLVEPQNQDGGGFPDSSLKTNSYGLSPRQFLDLWLAMRWCSRRTSARSRGGCCCGAHPASVLLLTAVGPLPHRPSGRGQGAARWCGGNSWMRAQGFKFWKRSGVADEVHFIGLSLA